MSLPASLDIRLLNALIALVDEASVTKAAERVSMTQPRMSNALARLRELTGDPLLVRSGQRLVPTGRAIEIAAGVRSSLTSLHGALEQPETFDPVTSTRSFVLAMSDYVSVMLLPGIMSEMQATAPRITIRVKSIEPPLVDRWLDEEECDVAFGALTHLNDRLHASVLLHDKAVCIARNDLPGVVGTITIDQYLDLGHVVTSGTPTPVSTLEQMIDAALAEDGRHRRIAARATSGFALATTVSRTDLIATLPNIAAAAFARCLPLQILHLPFLMTPFDVTMVWHERLHRDPGHLWLRRTMRNVAREFRRLENP
ncbi:DNA-binding transcriptional LysR family regulator [Sphingobium xenophagum]|uniref:DNA-binding transcriptional LysR family regulator n=1 Tax=Sphingobium xenophagum TaxID=121428 RepID=A0ABU1X2D9_SPHXE|nr:LysR family transcriptional regulator [Sphingobium xenophagum]MDR7155740.1 DNA-binding transcriptional LysR family regulator [Sphingobium xenophagum]